MTADEGAAAVGGRAAIKLELQESNQLVADAVQARDRLIAKASAEGLSMREMGEVLGVSAATIHGWIQRTRAQVDEPEGATSTRYLQVPRKR